MKKVWKFLRKFWWLILATLAFVAGLSFRKGKKNPDVELLKGQRKDLQKEEEELKKEQERLEREAEEIEKKRYFNDPVDAANYINNELCKRK
jgi:cell division protein FtsB